MSGREQLHLYIGQVQHRLRLDASARGAAIVAAVALATTVALTLLLNHYAFPAGGVAPARVALFAIVAAAVGLGLAGPWMRLNRMRSVYRAEAAFPALDQRLLTFTEREKAGDPFIELLAADTLAVAGDAPPVSLAPQGRLLAMVAAAAVSVGILCWMVTAAPGYLGYGAKLLWAGPKHEPVPIYEIQVTPGDMAVRRNSDQMVTAEVVGMTAGKVDLYAKYQSSSKWEPVAMQPQLNGTGYQFLFAGLPESVEYYVQAGAVKSKQFKFRVVDLPAVKSIQVTYRYPKWTGMQTAAEEQGGDLRALEGTDAELTLTMDSPLKDGVLALQDPDGNASKTVKLTGGEGNRYHATIHMDQDGAYHVAAIAEGQPVRLSEDYFISTARANPPEVSIDRPGQDYRASPIEEVTVGVHTSDEFGLSHVSLHYSVNGGPDKEVNLLRQPGAKNADGNATLSLEEFKLAPGDVVSLYATASDAHAEAKTDIRFIQAEPFEREFSQSQESGGGGGGGSGGQDQTEISRRQKELIAQTWKQSNDKRMTGEQTSDMGKVLADAQAKLREQVLALSARVQSRELSTSTEEFTSFDNDMQIAAEAMAPAADKLKQQAWRDALQPEQKALQALLRAEATFRKIQVAFGSRGGGAGSGGRDLASLFDLELDTEKNQYETAQTGSPQEEQAKKVDDALAKLDALAKRQEELAQKQQGKDTQSFEQRWQQEMLRREAEQLQREMEQMQKSGQQTASAGQQGQQGASGSEQSGSQSSGVASSGSQASGGAPSGSDPRVQQALSRLRSANEAMKRAGAPQAGGGQSGGQQTSAQQQAAQAAAQRLREATNLLGGAQTDQANGKLDQMASEAARLAQEERAQADRIKALSGKVNGAGTPSEAERTAEIQERNRLASERQQLSDDLSHLEKRMRDTARGLASNQPDAASKLREALGGMDQADLGNRVQRTADWLRRGINPESNGTEAGIANDLKSLDEQMHRAQRAMGPAPKGAGKGGQNGTQTAELDSLDRLRTQLQGMGRPGQEGQQGGQKSGPQGGQQGGQRGSQGGPAGGNARGGDLQGDRGGQFNPGGGGDRGAAWDVDTGNQRYDPNRRVAAPDRTPTPADTQRMIEQGMRELNQLRTLARTDPAAQREIDALAKEMQNLDPARFPGNPAMVEELHTKVLNDVDKLELQLRRSSDDPQTAQVRTNKSTAVPPGYQDAVAEYFKKLGKGQ